MDFLMNAYRDIRSEDESSSDSDSSEDLTPTPTPIPLLEDEPPSGQCSDPEDKCEEDKEKERTFGRTQMLADLGIFDLPPIEDLTISVSEQECIPIGVIHNIIDMLIIVAARKGCPAIDLDSVLFLDHGKNMLGKVLDVFGPVSEPMYMVRFNSAEDIAEKGIQIGMEVYFAPRTKHTAYVFLDSLFQQKGSDASWENDQEPPEHCLDYSDDEEERKAKAAFRNKKRAQPESNFEQTKDNVKKLHPRTQQNTYSRGRQRGGNHNQRGGHHNQRRQPPNPFYMSLSNKYAGSDQAASTTATVVTDLQPSQVAVELASSIRTGTAQPELVNHNEIMTTQQLEQPICKIPQLDTKDSIIITDKAPFSTHQNDSIKICRSAPDIISVPTIPDVQKENDGSQKAQNNSIVCRLEHGITPAPAISEIKIESVGGQHVQSEVPSYTAEHST